MTSRQFDDLKNECPFAAGAMAFKLMLGRTYGCHFGMRSTLEASRKAFYAGYDAAERFAREAA